MVPVLDIVRGQGGINRSHASRNAALASSSVGAWPLHQVGIGSGRLIAQVQPGLKPNRSVASRLPTRQASNFVWQSAKSARPNKSRNSKLIYASPMITSVRGSVL